MGEHDLISATPLEGIRRTFNVMHPKQRNNLGTILSENSHASDLACWCTLETRKKKNSILDEMRHQLSLGESDIT